MFGLLKNVIEKKKFSGYLSHSLYFYKKKYFSDRITQSDVINIKSNNLDENKLLIAKSIKINDTCINVIIYIY